MGKNLVIVESPAKAKTINKYLGKGFVVKSSVGHIRDLPTSSSGGDKGKTDKTSMTKEEKAKVKNETKSTSDSPSHKSSPRKTKKLSYKDQRELETLPADIEQLESDVEALQLQVNDPEFFRQDNDTTAETLSRLADKENALALKYSRWDELESMLEDNQQ